jgi:hypothetical protein
MYLFWFTSSLSFVVLCLLVAENISLTYAKIFLLIVLFDSCLSHVITSYTILGSPKVRIFPSLTFCS